MVGAIDISNTTRTIYDVYATGITGNGLYAPGAIVSGTRDALNGLIFASQLSAPIPGLITANNIAQGKELWLLQANYYLCTKQIQQLLMQRRTCRYGC